MVRNFAIPLLPIALIGCEAEPPNGEVSVEMVIENIHDWSGETTEVVGWLGNCEGYDCALYPTLQDARIAAESKRSSDRWRAAMDRRLSIGFSENFDAKAKPLQFEQVRILARIGDECWQLTCLDRAPDLEPISIEAVDSISERN